MVDVRYTVCSDGQVTKRNFCHPVAPSTEAASYRSAGIDKRAATRIRVQNGSDFQMCIRIAKASASCGSFSQFGPSSAVSLKMIWLITPHSGLSMNRTDRIVGIDGTAQGRMKISETQRIHGRCWTKKPDSNSATTILI